MITPNRGKAESSRGTNSYYSYVLLSSSSHRFLADHCFQGVVVAPGMLHVALAIQASLEAYQRIPTRLRDFRFDRAIIVSEFDTSPFTLALDVPNEPDSVKFTISEQDATDAYATGRVEFEAKLTPDATDSIDQIRTRCSDVIDGPTAYMRFRSRQNQYGPAFQGILNICHGQDEALAVLADPDSERSELWQIDPCLLDWCVQALALADTSEERTFTLVGFNELRIISKELQGAQVHARISERRHDSLIGDLDVIASDGSIALQMSGVELKYLDASHQLTVCVAANFTAEPVFDSLEFWSDKFSMPLDVQFAAYNQVYQELLDPASLFSLNANGTNILFINLEDWLGEHSTLTLHRPSAERDTLLAGTERYMLSPGVEIGQINQYETRYLHKEIFVDRAYCRYGIDFRNARCVLDVGANIGLFSLFCESESPGVKVLAFEPSPPVYELVSTNTQLYAPGAKVFNMGLSDTNGEAEFTYYRNSSVFSTFHADEKEDHDAIEAVVKNVLEDELGDGSDTDYYANALTEGRTSSETFVCQLRTVSQIIRDENLDHIDILKVDAEKSELAVLRGIEKEHWPIIQQIVLEVHDSGEGEIDEACALLKGHGFDVAVDQEKLLERSGLYSVFARRAVNTAEENIATPETGPGQKLSRHVDEFVEALEVADQRGGAPILVSLTPASAELNHTHGGEEAVARAEKRLTHAIASMSGVYLLPNKCLQNRYRLQSYFDSNSNIIGHIPYTPECYAALGTEVFRSMKSLLTSPKKVLVLDCDNTLWKGVCGEDGTDGLVLEEGHLALQQLAVDCRERGILVCLASKNEEADVMRVFDERQDMVLRREHLSAWQINWGTKSDSLLSFAEDLNLGLDAFVFLDDNPVECAEVRASCPEMLTIQVPTKSRELVHFVNHLWALDGLRVTDEDRRRAVFYDEEKERKKLRTSATTITDFIESLGLQVDVFEPGPEDYERTSQLTQRTNQFNFTTLRCSTEDVRKFIAQENGGWILVRVKDRFGDYGIVGAARYHIETKFCVEAFMISCRVLGRGVEHQVLAALGRIARDRGCSELTLEFRRSKKNEPALNFLVSIFGTSASQVLSGIAEGGERELVISTEAAIAVVFDPAANQLQSAGSTRRRGVSGQIPASHSVLELIPRDLSSGRQVLDQAMAMMMKPRPDLESKFVAPQSKLEELVCKAWSRALKLETVGIDDDFFDLGGTSLLAVQVASELSDSLGRRVSTIAMFEGRTVHALAASLDDDTSRERAAKLDASADRGKQRRARRKRRGRSE